MGGWSWYVRHIPLRRYAALTSALLVTSAASAAEWVAAPHGTPAGEGTGARPWDIATAFGHPGAVKPGDTIWLLGGTYRIEGALTGRLKGTEKAPILVRQYPGHRATIDTGASRRNRILIGGEHAWYWGFEVTSSAEDRWGVVRGLGVDCGNSGINRGIKFINLVVHDTAGCGFGFWNGAVDSEIYGCLIYYSGWDASDRGHGHAIYAQNTDGVKRLVDNIMFGQHSHGIHAYGSSRAYLNNFHIEGNISFNNGCVSTVSGLTRNILVGGGRVAENPKVIDNYTYFPPEGRGGTSCDCGYGKGCSGLMATGNCFAGGGSAFRVKDPSATITKNVFVGPVRGFPSAEKDNQVIRGAQAARGLRVFVRPNRYEPGRAHIVVFNWDRRPTAAADVSGVLERGDEYELRDAQNYFGRPVMRGRFEGRPIEIPMNLSEIARPVGGPAKEVAHTAPRFGAFVLVKTGRVERT